jgi:ferredoxin--NADP+ reductase
VTAGSADGRRLAVVGAGPAGLYAVQHALRIPEIATVDVFDRLPTPYGLVRYGVAADHAKTKSVVRAFQRILDRDDVHFFGNVAVGADLQRAELRQHYDAVVYATGAALDRSLGIPGEEFVASAGAGAFVSWYSGHPDVDIPAGLPPGPTAVVAGAGNVALDVTRILAKAASLLSITDMPDAVVRTFQNSQLTDVHVLIRRGPAQVKFSPVELRELGELDGVHLVVDPADLALAEDPAVGGDVLTRDAESNLRILREWSCRPSAAGGRRIHFHFWTRPTEITGPGRVTGITLSRRRPGEVPVTTTLAADLVIRAIGYRARPIAGLPFDEDRGIVPHNQGRVLDGAGVVPGEYVAGWLKRGPSGVIGTNRSDAGETVASLAADLPGLPRATRPSTALGDLLAARGIAVVDWAGWKRLEAFEASLGTARGATTVKITDRRAIVEICSGLRSRP